MEQKATERVATLQKMISTRAQIQSDRTEWKLRRHWRIEWKNARMKTDRTCRNLIGYRLTRDITRRYRWKRDLTRITERHNRKTVVGLKIYENRGHTTEVGTCVKQYWWKWEHASRLEKVICDILPPKRRCDRISKKTGYLQIMGSRQTSQCDNTIKI